MSDEDNTRVPVYHHQDYEKETQTPGHPESPRRVKAIMDRIEEMGLPVEVISPGPASEEDISSTHSKNHIDKIRDFGVGFMDPDTYHHDGTYAYSLMAAGGAIEAALDAYDNRRATFAMIRPPGHHAGYDFNMGFCYFNNISIATKHLMKNRSELERIAIVDIDAHHGNGTDQIFQSDPAVLYISTHQWGIFPGTGHEKETGYGYGGGRTVNLPFRGGTGDPTYGSTWDEIMEPVLRQFQPQMILVSMGADAHLMDPLTGLTLSSNGYRGLLRGLFDISSDLTGGRMMFTLEGGYHLDALAETFADAINMASGSDTDFDLRYNDTREMGVDKRRIRDFLDIQASYWGL